MQLGRASDHVSIFVRVDTLCGAAAASCHGLVAEGYSHDAQDMPALVDSTHPYKLVLVRLAMHLDDSMPHGGMQGVLGVFQKLIASKAHDHEGFFILNSLLEYLPMELYQQYLPHVRYSPT